MSVRLGDLVIPEWNADKVFIERWALVCTNEGMTMVGYCTNGPGYGVRAGVWFSLIVADPGIGRQEFSLAFLYKRTS